MSVWVCAPSKRPVEQVELWAAAWRARGYKIALWRDDMDFPYGLVNYISSEPPYPGYAQAMNSLIRDVLHTDEKCEWVVAAADDVHPDPNHTPEEIAAQCADHFAIVGGSGSQRTFGVVQPTGDRWGDKQGAYIDRVAGSPWIGREFARRAYGGKGPYWPDYFHMGVDEELQAVAEKLGVFWQRPDLTHHHAHWGRPLPGERMAPSERMPEFLRRANSAEQWMRYKRIFAERKAAGFPGSEPL